MSGPWRLFGWALLAVSMALALAGGAGWWLYHEMTAAGPLGEARKVVIPPKTGLAEIAGLLAKAGVVRHALPFEAAALLSGEVSNLQAGEYEFPAATSAVQATAIIASGKTVRRKLTIPEGLTSAEVLALVKAAPALAGDPGPLPPEGSLMPDTYFYSYSQPRRQLIDEMKREMAHALQRAWAKRATDLPLTNPEQLLTLASIVEGEAARADERAHIAGVFVNRLRLGMPLEFGPDGDLRADRRRCQKARPAIDARRSRNPLALQHLSRKGAAGGPDRQSGGGRPARRRPSGPDRRPLFRRRP